jgi:uncharacterized LabA/DUF88 family protein
MDKRGKSIYAFVDAANMFYGGEKSLHFRIDYERLLGYLREKYGVSKVFYYAGVDVDTYKAEGRGVNLLELSKYYEGELLKKDKTEEEIALFEMHQKRVKFFLDLTKIGYELRIKPTKVFTSTEGTTTTKANCDVDLTFDMMRYMSQYSEALVLSGDGDFAPIVEYLKDKKKKIRIMARSERTAREMRELAGEDFVDFKTIKKEIEAMRGKAGNLNKPQVFDGIVGTSKPGMTEVKKKKIPEFRKGF